MYNEQEDSLSYLGKNNFRLFFLKNNKYKYKSHKGIKSKKPIERNVHIDSYFSTNKHSSTSNTSTSSFSYQDYLLKKLNNLHKINQELNTQLKKLSEKSKNLMKEISDNKSKYLIIKKDFDKEINTNKDLKLKLKNALISYEKEKEINEIKEEQNILTMTLKSKDKILNNLNNTLSSMNKEIEEDKKMNETIIKDKDKQIQELKKILEQLNIKYEENNKNIELLKKQKEEEKNKKNLVILKKQKEEEKNKNKNKSSNNNIPVQNNNNIIQDSNNIITQNQKNNINNLSIQINNNNNNINKNQNNNRSYQHLLTISEKADNNSEDSERSLVKLSSIIIHRKAKSKEASSYQYLEDIETNIYSYSEGNTIKSRTKNTNEISKDSFYLYTITKDGKLLEFDLMEKKYQKIKKSQIKDWNSFISEYSSYNDGSSLLNTFQGLFILTGKDYKNLYYYSKKYNSVSKINQFNFGHKYGSLILTPNCENIIAIGGETKQVEILNIETGKIQILPNLLTTRINSAYSFIDDKLFAFFGKNNNQIEFLNITNNTKWELFNLIKNEYKQTKEGLSAITLNNSGVIFLGNITNNKVMFFNYIKRKMEYKDISIQSKNQFNKYNFDKDKYFNNFINFEKIGKDGNYLNQFVGIDSIGNIHYFNNDFTYSIINNENL